MSMEESVACALQDEPGEAGRGVAELLQREKTCGLDLEERSELDHYVQIEHLMRLAKARARQHLSIK